MSSWDDDEPRFRWWWYYSLDQWRYWMLKYEGPAMWLARMAGYQGA